MLHGGDRNAPNLKMLAKTYAKTTDIVVRRRSRPHLWAP